MAAIDDLQARPPRSRPPVRPDRQGHAGRRVPHEFTQNGRNLLFKGVAESSTRVSTLMRNIADSPTMADPRLQVVQSGQAQRGAAAAAGPGRRPSSRWRRAR
jgi:type IV pilus assembly protein PilN